MKQVNYSERKRRPTTIYLPGTIINGHTIIKKSFTGDILINCGKCGTKTYKSRKAVISNKGCRYCKKTYNREAYIYGIPNKTIATRLSRGWTKNQAFELEPRKIKSEDFAAKDSIFLSKFLEEDFSRSKITADLAEHKYKKDI